MHQPSSPSFRQPTGLFALVVPALLAAALCAASVLAQAAQPSQRRLQISIDYVRQVAGAQIGADRARTRLSQQLVLTAVLSGDGTPMVENPLDPDAARRQLERAQGQQQQMQAALNRQQARGGATSAAPIDMAAMQARAQQMQARCGADRECLMREAMALSAAQVAGKDRSVQDRLATYGGAVQACERQAPAGAAREACIANARRQAGGADDASDRDDAVETPYLHFIGKAACQLDVTTKVDERTDGQFQDVQGSVPFTETVQAEQRKRDDSVCPLLQVVLDTRTGRLWAHYGLALREAPGVTVRSEKGRAPQRSEGPVALHWHEANDWLARRLQNLNAAGSDDIKLPAGVAGRGDGQIEIRMRWKFEPV